MYNQYAMQFDLSWLFNYLKQIVDLYWPRVAEALMIVLAGWLIGRALGKMVYRLVDRVGFGMAFRKTSIGRALLRSGYTGAKSFAVATKWFVYLLSIYIAIEVLSIPILTTFVASIMLYLPNVAVGVFVLIIGFILADWVGDLVKKSGSGAASEHLGPFGDVVRAFLYFVSTTIALAQMKIDITIVYIFAQAFAWAIAIGFGVAFGIAFGWQLKDRVKPWIDMILPKPSKVKKGAEQE